MCFASGVFFAIGNPAEDCQVQEKLRLCWCGLGLLGGVGASGEMIHLGGGLESVRLYKLHIQHQTENYVLQNSCQSPVQSDVSRFYIYTQYA